MQPHCLYRVELINRKCVSVTNDIVERVTLTSDK